jgi:hypothetical protein
MEWQKRATVSWGALGEYKKGWVCKKGPGGPEHWRQEKLRTILCAS